MHKDLAVLEQTRSELVEAYQYDAMLRRESDCFMWHSWFLCTLCFYCWPHILFDLVCLGMRMFFLISLWLTLQLVYADHWLLGAEYGIHCYTLKGTPEPNTIPTPAGLLMRWVKPIDNILEEGECMSTTFEVTIPDEDFFWDSLNSSLNKTKHRSLCSQPCPGQASCCIFHANIHSCKHPASCEPWIKPANGTDGEAMVTHTPSQWGPWGNFTHHFALPAGTWNIIAHVKVLDFQCAIGAARVVSPRSTTSGALLIVVNTVAFVLIVVAIVIVLRRRRTNTRDNSNAPKNPLSHVAILFTDIQSSTALWATIPVAMAEALELHHRETRRLIQKYNCYEVKTIGDSFMIVSESPEKLARLALELQVRFHELDWGTSDIDAIYNEMTDLGKMNTAGEVQLVVPETNAVPWNGLRIRCGLHYAKCDIKYDPVTKGYDYFGPAVNTTARIESVCHGGQVGMSEDAYAAVFPNIGSAATWRNLGEVPLRGVPEPVTIYQVLPVALAHRVFGPLRVDIQDEVEFDDDANTTEFGSADGQSSVGHELRKHMLVRRGIISADDLKRNYDTVMASLHMMLSALSKKDKEIVLRPICKRLNVPFTGTRLPATIQAIAMRTLPSTVQSAQYPTLLGRRGSVASAYSVYATDLYDHDLPPMV